jgi:hypothetical protein
MVPVCNGGFGGLLHSLTGLLELLFVREWLGWLTDCTMWGRSVAQSDWVFRVAVRKRVADWLAVPYRDCSIHLVKKCAAFYGTER